MTLDRWTHELRLAWRGLRRARTFTAAAVVTLGVGMAGATAIFALIQGVLLRPLPMRAPDQLIVVTRALPSTGNTHWPFRRAEVDRMQDAERVFAGLAAVGYNDPSQMAYLDGPSSGVVNVARVTGAFFQVLDVAPVLGRTLTGTDDAPGAEPVVVLTYAFWQHRYGGASDIVGRRVTLEGQRFTVVGVMPPDIEFPRGVDVWMTVETMASAARGPVFGEAVRNELHVVARLQPEVSLAQVTDALAIMAPQLDALAPPAGPQGSVPLVRPLAEVVVGDVRGGLLVLLLAVGLVLLIASANVANLLLVRGESRKAEVALRVALGATRLRLAGAIMVESFVLTVGAGALGVLASWASVRGVVAFVPGGLPRLDAVHLDAGVVVFVGVLGFLTAAGTGLVPALAMGRADLLAPLRHAGRTTARSSFSRRRVLVVAQVALAVTVVAAAGLIARSLIHLQATGAAMGADRLTVVSLVFPSGEYERNRHLQFLEEAIAQLEAVSGIDAVTPINATPFSGVGWDVPTFTADGQGAVEAADNPSLNLEAIHPGYFDAFGVAIVQGRPFGRQDRSDAPLVAIVSDEVARRTWPDEAPIGKRLKMGDVDSEDPWRTVVGVAAQTRYRDLRTPQPTLYLPAEQMIVTAESLVLRAAVPPALLADAVRDTIGRLDPTVRVSGIVPFGDLLREPLARPRFYTLVLGLFGATALLLAAVGLYAVISATVRQRTREIGVRIALGASPRRVRRLVVREAMMLGALGAVAGLVAAAGSSRLLRGLLYEVQPLDPTTLTAAALLLIGVAALASYLPAQAAARIDPLLTLRAE
jgi:predicted permease